MTISDVGTSAFPSGAMRARARVQLALLLHVVGCASFTLEPLAAAARAVISPAQQHAIVAAAEAVVSPAQQQAIVAAASGAVEQAAGAVLSPSQLAQLTAQPSFGPVSAGVGLLTAACAARAVSKYGAEAVLLPVLLNTNGAFLQGSLRGDYIKGKGLGGGSFGTVFAGLRSERDARPAVVIKQLRSSAKLSEDFALAELYINRKLSLCGQSGRMAPFLGHYISDAGLLSLVFKYEGEFTLGQALKADFPWNIEAALAGGGRGGGAAGAARLPAPLSPEEELARSAKVVRKVAAQLFDDLAGIHEWSIVHRDVKGSNLLFCDRERRFKLIDFGAACDVVSRINYSESLQPFDPKHCPPEAPPAEGGLVLRSGGRFDVFSAGLLLVQMCFPPHRSDDGIVAFKRSLAQQHEWKLQAWRESVEGSAAYDPGFRLLDRNGGWELLRRCLKRRPGDRISSAKAAASGFCRA